MKLLTPEQLIKTSKVDHADWNYKPFWGWIIRSRYRLITSLLNNTQCQRLLEVGYGSGVFMPELAHFCEELHGVDIHNKADIVQKILQQEGVRTILHSASVEKTIFPGNYFDYVVAVSALEFVHNIEAAAHEIHRILKPDGFLFVVTPGYTKILDIGLKMITGESARLDYENRREKLLPALLEKFIVVKSLVVPPLIGQFVPLYRCLKLRPI